MKAQAALALLLLATAAGAGAETDSLRGARVLYAGGKAPAAASRPDPAPANPETIRAGEQLFAAMNCDGCHGIGALGFVGPSLVDGRWRFGGDDLSIYDSIFAGRPHGMPAYGGLLSEATIWQLVHYLQAQPLPRNVPTTSWP